MTDRPPAGAPTVLRVARTFAAPLARVFAAWTEPAQLVRWWGPRGYTTPRAEVDLRPGGAYRIEMRGPDGECGALVGRFLEVRPCARLVYTWSYEGRAESLVTVEFHARGAATEVVVLHARLAEAVRDPHARGWAGCFDHLAHALQGD